MKKLKCSIKDFKVIEVNVGHKGNNMDSLTNTIVKMLIEEYIKSNNETKEAELLKNLLNNKTII